MRITKTIVIILLLLFSFFYTEKTIDVIREVDPIMQTLKKREPKFKISAVNAMIKEESIVPGLSGKTIDLDKSYKKMKQYGKYNESLLVFKEVEPSVSSNDYYDKYITAGNTENKKVSLIFPIERDDNIDDILTILSNYDVVGTFFLDGLFLENNQDLVSSMSKLSYEIEILNYDYKYQEVYFKEAMDILKNNTNQPAKYCYAEYNNKKVLNLCNKLNLHTIIPNIKTKNNPYVEVKTKLTNGSMISFENNNYTISELSTIISYIKQKGYNIVTLDNLLSESNLASD